MLCGHRPFNADDFISLGYKHVTEPPPHIRQFNTTIPLHIEQALLRAMAKDRSARFEDIAEFLHVLQQAQQQHYGPVPYIQQSQSVPLARQDTILASAPPPLPPSPYQTIAPLDTPARVTRTLASPAAFQPYYSGGSGNVLVAPEQQKVPDKFYSLGGGWRLLSMLCYLIPVIGLPVYFFVGRRNRFTRYHALQSLLLWLIMLLISSARNGTALFHIVSVLSLIVAVYLIGGVIASLLGKYIRIPLISPRALRYADRRLRYS